MLEIKINKDILDLIEGCFNIIKLRHSKEAVTEEIAEETSQRMVELLKLLLKKQQRNSKEVSLLLEKFNGMIKLFISSYTMNTEILMEGAKQINPEFCNSLQQLIVLNQLSVLGEDKIKILMRTRSDTLTSVYQKIHFALMPLLLNKMTQLNIFTPVFHLLKQT